MDQTLKSKEKHLLECLKAYDTLAVAFSGGVDKRCIAQGGKSIEDELKRIRPAIKSGGYIPGCDHAVPHDVSWANYMYYVKLLAKETGWL